MREELKAGTLLIVERTLAYALRIVELYRELAQDEVGRVLGRQLLRSGTSVGANVHEAQGAQSKADFISKISIAYKEARESAYWLILIQKAKLAVSVTRIHDLIDETHQLIKILGSILLTAKRGRVPSSPTLHS